MTDPVFVCTEADRPAWLEARRTGVGGSDAAAILGLSPYTNAVEVYLDKIGEGEEFVPPEWMKWGQVQEPLIRQEYANTTGRIVRDAGLLRHGDHPFMLGSLDGVTDCRRVLECKADRFGIGYGTPGTDEVPPRVLCQVQQYMTVTGFEVADVAVLVGGSDFRLYEVPADAELQGMLIEAEADFWESVQRREPPEPTSVEEAQARWRSSSTGQITATAAHVEALAQIAKFKKIQKLLEAREDAAKLEIMAALGALDTLIDLDGKVLATWKTSKPRRGFNANGLRLAHPELGEEFTTHGKASRRFLPK